ncbi:TonB C-terminal domain-containing protein [Helicobacter vulpis]|uniref:TonB C-terminal domain-containing protein n=1 Tax=Helicobacter vulpis TaxID=2316076 RepID=UPI000EB4F5DB|nr:TonB C-terminal domain-containing protein [Helicobacter vulpis]
MDKKLVIGSGVLACACYVILLVLLLSHTPPKKVSIPESLDVSLVMDSLSAPNPFEDLGVSGMFADIPDKQSPPPQNQPNRSELQRAQSLLKNIQLNQHQKAFEDLQSSLDTIKGQLQTLQHKSIDFQVPKQEQMSKQEYQEWFQELYQILYGRWKLSFKQPASVGALITISATGQFSFAIVEYSPFADYNQEIERLLTSLQDQKFPPYPKGAITLKVNFKTKDQ